MALHMRTEGSARPRPRLWLAAVHGRRLPAPSRTDVGPVDGPETILEVEFEGITEAEQRAALSAFPGGRRFVLKSSR